MQSRVGGEVRYSISVPEVQELRVVARTILIDLFGNQIALRAELAGAR